METKSQPQRKLLKRRKILQADELAPNVSRRVPVSALVASAKLPDRKLRQLIRCYADGRTPREAMEACGLSHVTVRRMYRQIRERLIDVGLYQPKIAPGAPAWWEERERPRLVAIMRIAVRPHQGVRDDKIDPYYAEAIYRRDSATAPGQLYRLILKAIADLGPLNRKPQLKWSAAHWNERFRLLVADMRSEIRRTDDPPQSKALLHGLVDKFEQRDLLEPSHKRDDDRRAIVR